MKDIPSSPCHSKGQAKCLASLPDPHIHMHPVPLSPNRAPLPFVHSDGSCAQAGGGMEDSVVAAAAVAAGRPSAHAPKAQAQELQEEEERPGAGAASPRAGPQHMASPGRQQPALATALCSHTPAASDYELSLDLKNKQVPRASQGGGEGGEGALSLGAVEGTRDIPAGPPLLQAHLFCHSSPALNDLVCPSLDQPQASAFYHGRAHTLAMPGPWAACPGALLLEQCSASLPCPTDH